jgi:hypothetical protein
MTNNQIDAYAIWEGLDAEFVAGSLDGRNPDSPEPSANRHPAYRHSWEVSRAEVNGKPIPAAFSRCRVAIIEAGGEFYPYDEQGRVGARKS